PTPPAVARRGSGPCARLKRRFASSRGRRRAGSAGMLRDRYGFQLSTSSPAARDAYVAAVDLSLSANAGTEDAFRRAIACDDGLAVAHVGLARTLQVQHRTAEARAAAARARELAAGLPQRERSHVNALATVVDKGSVAGLAAVKEHLAAYPRDAMVLAPCTGVFGLIGFSGRAGREAELLALLEPLAKAYGEDWWFLSALAFAQVEVGDIERAHPRPRLLRGRRACGGPRLPRGLVEGLSAPEPAPLPHQLAHRPVADGARPRCRGVGVLPRASEPRRLHRPAAQHAVRRRLLPAAGGDGGRAAPGGAVARAQRLCNAVVPRARYRLCRCARGARARLRR